MWDPQGLTTLWASMASYRDNFIIIIIIIIIIIVVQQPFVGP
jgi:Trk-type K+ transport system membrane component